MNANTVDVAAHVAGQVVKVYIRDQRNVSAGDPLFDIDARSYFTAWSFVAMLPLVLLLRRRKRELPAAME